MISFGIWNLDFILGSMQIIPMTAEHWPDVKLFMKAVLLRAMLLSRQTPALGRMGYGAY